MTASNRGKFVICAIVALGLAAAAFSVWYHYQGRHRSGDFWGTATARLIVDAPEVRALRLDAKPQEKFDDDGMPLEPPDAPVVEFGSGYWTVVADHDASKARGLLNVRHALVQDASFDWHSRRPEQPSWLYGLEFNDGRLWATVLFDLDSRQVGLSGGRQTAQLDPAASDAWRSFFEEQFVDREPAAIEPASDANQPAEEKQEGQNPADPEQPADKATDAPGGAL